MEVELSELLRTMANNSKDVAFNQALANAEGRKANSSADYVSLFVEEYKKLTNNSPLAPLFAAASNSKIKFTNCRAFASIFFSRLRTTHVKESM